MNFRESIKKNKRITFFVILTYLFIMALVGVLADISFNAEPGIGLVANMQLFATFQKMPYITLCILAISLIGVSVIHFWGHKIMLSGMDYELISSNEEDYKKKMAFNILEEMSISAGLRYIPKLYYLESNELNAFAAGWHESNALVGVTAGLLDTLNRAELQSVIAHEVGHIIHGDSRLTMYVGILANVILTITDIFAHIFYFSGRSSSSKEANMARMLLVILNLVLPIITQVLYLFLSRTREYMADAAAVKLTGDNQSMINALNKISHHNTNVSSGYDTEDEDKYVDTGEKYRSAAYIFSKGDSIFSTHPSIENRIKALQGRKK